MDKIVYINTSGHSITSLQELVYKLSIDYVVRHDDLEWDTLCFSFKEESQNETN